MTLIGRSRLAKAEKAGDPIIFRLSTAYGNYYDVTASGNIIRLDQPGFQPSGKWKLVAVVDRCGRTVARLADVLKWIESKPDFNLKNGKPRYTVADFDHGTNRIWGNADYHGIRAIWPAEVL